VRFPDQSLNTYLSGLYVMSRRGGKEKKRRPLQDRSTNLKMNLKKARRRIERSREIEALDKRSHAYPREAKTGSGESWKFQNKKKKDASGSPHRQGRAGKKI